LTDCDSKFEHISKEEFGAGRKITSNLLIRFCSNIRGLWDKTNQLENVSNPELRKRFNPPVIHEQHSYGIHLNHENMYEFDNRTETVFLDGIGRRHITLRKFQSVGKDVWSKELNSTENIIQIRDRDKETLYTPKQSKDEVETAVGSYYIDKDRKVLYIHPKNDNTDPVVLVVVSSNESLVDSKNTTAFVDLEKNQIKAPYQETSFKEEIVDLNTATNHITTKDKDGSDVEMFVPLSVDRYWNIGWMKTAPFHISTLQLSDPFGEDPTTPSLPSISRAFTIIPGHTGLLTQIGLQISAKKGAEDDLYLEIRKTTQEGKLDNVILARERLKLRGLNQQIHHKTRFNHPPLLNKGEKYAVVLRSGFTSSGQAYGLGGWTDTKHEKSAFLKEVTNTFHSRDNCQSWISLNDWIQKEGSTPIADALFGTTKPQLYSYKTLMKPLDPNAQYEKGDYVVYWKPIHSNPIEKVQLVPTMENYGNNVVWQVSINMIDWHTLYPPKWTLDFTKEGSFEQNTYTLYIRATIKATTDYTPVIKGLKVIISTKKAEEAYLKTLFYNPRFTQPLSASLWSGLDTQIETNSSDVVVEVDVIRNTTKTEYIPVKGDSLTFSLEDYPAQPLLDVIMHPPDGGEFEEKRNEGTVNAWWESNNTGIEQIKARKHEINEIYKKIKDNTPEKDKNLNQTLKKALEQLNETLNKEQKKTEDNQQLDGEETLVKRLESFKKELESLGERIQVGCKRDCLMTICIETLKILERLENTKIEGKNNILPPIPGRKVVNPFLTEKRDYNVDYSKKELVLVDSWGCGLLEVRYHPLWLRGIQPKEFPLKTDIFQEEYQGTGREDVFTLKVVPLDPIRSLKTYNKTTKDWDLLKEDEDYRVNYSKKKLQMLKDTVKPNGDVKSNYQVIYTPYLVEDGLALAYRMYRGEFGHQAFVKGCYYQNRV
jgi:hypothetical protein